MAAPRLDDQVCFQLYTASRLLTRAYKPVLAALGLTYPQFLAMMVLWEWADAEGPDRSVRSLGRRLKLDSGTLTPLLKRLEDKGYVRRTRSRADERVVHITLTEAGASLKDQAEGLPESVLRSRGLGDAEVAALAALHGPLSALVAQLSEDS